MTPFPIVYRNYSTAVRCGAPKAGPRSFALGVSINILELNQEQEVNFGPSNGL